jgi:hypothetical protein
LTQQDIAKLWAERSNDMTVVSRDDLIQAFDAHPRRPLLAPANARADMKVDVHPQLPRSST